jgi:cytochrome oxidase Cu insertion factor (SCO1/SenC/PrrC family)/DNA-binding beta-propeller fold protein YncE
MMNTTMNPNSSESKQSYQTTDLTLTSFLRCRGFAIESIKQNNGRTLFVFKESPELRLAILDFANDAAIAVRSFCSTMRDLKAITRVLVFFFAAVVGAHSTLAQQPQKIEREGVEIEFTIAPVKETGKSYELMEAKEATVRFKINDKASKTPLSGVKPSVWLSQRGENPADEKVCREKIQSFLQGSLRSRPDVDLNAYFVLALNEESNISVIDPLLGFGSSKLLTLVMLKSPGEDWAQKNSDELLFVSMPGANQVAVVDTNTWRVVSNIDAGMKPSRVRLQPDQRYLWIGNDAAVSDQSGGVTVIDTTTLKVVAQLATGNGHHEIDFSSDNRFAFVTNETDGTLSVIDIQKLAKVKDLKTGAPATSLAISAIGNALYLVNESEGSIAVVDTRRQEIATRIQTKPGITNVRFAPGGRWGFVPNAKENVVYVFDASTNRLAHTISVDKGPDQVAFTDAFAYLRSTGSTEVSMVRLSTLTGQPDIAKFPGGQTAPADASVETSADVIVPAPEGNSVLVANPADRVIYYYSEGMAAPMGSFQNYRRKPRALMVVDRSLREVTSGVYTTTTKLPKSGNYDIAFLLDSPRITHCFTAEAKPNPDVPREKKVALQLEYLNKDRKLHVDEDYKLRFKIVDATTLKAKSDLKDVRVLTLLSSGIWQKRDFARSVGDGVYELDIRVPQTGSYFVFVESRSQGVAFRQLPMLTLEAAASAAHHHHAQLKTYSCPMHPDVTSKKKGRCPKCGMDLRPSEHEKKDAAEGAPVAAPTSKMNIPDVELLDQNGRKVHFYTDLVKGQTVVINFIFTTCTTICPPLGATFARVQKELGEGGESGRDVRLISISVDPVTDTPERLKAWGAKFHAGEGWTLVTGDKPQIDELLNALGASTARREDHSPTILIGNDARETWTRTYGIANTSKLLQIINNVLAGKSATTAEVSN